MVATSLTFLLFLALCYGAWAQPPPYCTPFVQGISLGFAGSGIPVQNKAGSSTTYHFMLKVNTNIIVNASDWIVYAGIFTYRSILSQQFGYNMGTQNLNALQLPFGPVKNTSYSYRFDVTNNSVGVYYAAASITIAKPDFSMACDFPIKVVGAPDQITVVNTGTGDIIPPYVAAILTDRTIYQSNDTINMKMLAYDISPLMLGGHVVWENVANRNIRFSSPYPLEYFDLGKHWYGMSFNITNVQPGNYVLNTVNVADIYGNGGFIIDEERKPLTPIYIL